MANRTQPFNARALQQMGVPMLDSGIDGRGIAIGFIDYGFDILHPCLREAGTGASRIRHLWDQNTGREFDTAAINELIRRAEQFGRQSADEAYDPHANYFGQHAVQGRAHGTLISSIAAGSAVAGFRGVAPGASMIAVQLGLLDHHWKEEDENGNPTWTSWKPELEPLWNDWRSYDEALQIIDALEYIYERAKQIGARGLVINLSIGAYTGAHDGRSPVERKITEIVHRGARAGYPCAVVVSAGNAGIEEGHFCGEAQAGHPLTFEWRMNEGDLTQNKLEIWYSSDTPLNISVSARSGSSVTSIGIAPGRTHSIEVGGIRAGIADHVLHARKPLSRARILIHPPFVPRDYWSKFSGELSFKLRCEVAHDSEGVPVHAWVERDDGITNRSTLHPSHPTSTLSGLAAAKDAIVVAGYNHDLSASEPGIFPPSSIGPLPWPSNHSDQTPHICAPGHRIWGARSKSMGFVETSGTSAATAFTSGIIALLMQRFGNNRRWSGTREIIDLLIDPNIRKPWSPRFGFGPVNIAHIFEEVTA